jgi:hypothetical protein
MKIEPSIKGVSRFLKDNDDLIKDIRSGKEILENLADRVKSNRDATEEIVENIGKIPFKVAKKQDVRDRQKKLLEEIMVTRKKIHIFRDDPTMMGLFEGNLSALYLELGNTHIEESVENMVTFTQEEVDDIRVLLRRATLDAQARQNMAHILDAAVQIGKLTFKIALNLAA